MAIGAGGSVAVSWFFFIWDRSEIFMERAGRQCGAAARLSVLKQRKGILGVSVYRASIFASPLGRGGRAQRGRRGKTMTISFENGCTALSVTCGDSSPKGRAGELYPVTSVTSYVGMKKWSVSVLIRSIDCFMNTHLNVGVIYCLPVLITQGFRPSFHLAGADPSASALWGQRPKACRLRGASRLCTRGRLV